VAELVVVPRRTFLQFEDLIQQRVYTNPNPLVRWIFWRRLAALLRFSDEVDHDRALDFGCGEGAFLPTLCGRFRTVLAVDLNVGAARKLATHYRLRNVNLLEARAPGLPFDDGSFDFIVAADVMEHLRDLEPVVKELHRVLSPRGRLVISAPSENLFYEVGRKVFGFTKPDDHFHTPRGIESILERHFDLRHKKFLPLNLFEAASAFVLLSLGKPSEGVTTR